MLNVTFSKLADGNWGVRVEGVTDVSEVQPGTVLVANKKNGDQTSVTVSSVVLHRNGVATCAIVETRPARAYRGPRGVYRPRTEVSFTTDREARNAEAAALRAQQEAAAVADLPSERERIAALATDTAFSWAAEADRAQEDRATTFQRLLAGTYTTPESAVR
jgi:hypothetical protein